MLRRTMTQVKETHAAQLPLAGRNVVVTGASSGIGRAIALACARAGADLAATYRSNQSGADALAAEVAGPCRPLKPPLSRFH